MIIVTSTQSDPTDLAKRDHIVDIHLGRITEEYSATEEDSARRDSVSLHKMRRFRANVQNRKLWLLTLGPERPLNSSTRGGVAHRLEAAKR